MNGYTTSTGDEASLGGMPHGLEGMEGLAEMPTRKGAYNPNSGALR